MLGLAAVAVLSLSAFIGVASASATTVCSAGPSYTCPAGSSYAGSVFGSLNTNGPAATSAKLTATFATVSCTASTVTGSTTAAGAGSLTPAFSGCTTGGGSSCTVTMTGTPYSAQATFDAAHTGGRAGTLAVTSPSATIACTGLTTCVFSASSVTANVFNPDSGSLPNTQNKNGSGQGLGQVYFNGVTLTGSPSFPCGTGHWTSVYDLGTGSGPALGAPLWLDA